MKRFGVISRLQNAGKELEGNAQMSRASAIQCARQVEQNMSYIHRYVGKRYQFALFLSRCSQALTKVQSRLTVPDDTPKTSAVSSMLRPPKKRSSTILLLR